jgi:hypothetical protein
VARTLPHHHIKRGLTELASVIRADDPPHSAHRNLRNRLAAIIYISLLIDIALTAVVYFTERHAANTEIHSLFDAGLFSTSQLLTASAFTSPTTNLARVLALLCDIYSIFVIASLAGSFGAFFHLRTQERRTAAGLSALPSAAPSDPPGPTAPGPQGN